MMPILQILHRTEIANVGENIPSFPNERFRFPAFGFWQKNEVKTEEMHLFCKIEVKYCKNYKNIFVSFSTKALAIMAIVRFNFGNIVLQALHTYIQKHINTYIFGFIYRCKCLTLIQNTCFEVLPFLKESFTFLKKIILMFNLLFTWQLTHTPKNLPLFWCL